MTALTPTQLSTTGATVSSLIAGFWRTKHWGMSAQELLAYIEQLLELGITTMDHAMVYRSQAPFGAALALQPSVRQRMEIIGKCGIRPAGFGPLGAQDINHYDSSAQAIIESVDASLQELGTDYLDVLLLHRPDYLMQAEEVATAFEQLHQQGKVRHFGVSNFSTHQFERLQQQWQPGLVTNQIELSPLNMQALDSGVLEQCSNYGVRPMLWSCLAGGALLTPVSTTSQRVHSALQQVATELDTPHLEQVVYAWVTSLPSQPIPLLGTSKIERAAIAVRGAQQKLTREQWYRIWEAANGAPVP